jgi:hypothetical protein
MLAVTAVLATSRPGLQVSASLATLVVAVVAVNLVVAA